MNTAKLIELLPELAVFVTVVEENSFSKAGAKLNLPPSSISRSVSKLEKRLATKLLERTTRKLALNSIGREVYGAAKEMLESAQSAMNVVQQRQELLTGELRIAAPKAFAKRVLMPITFSFMEQHPQLAIKLTASDLVIDPAGGEVDILFRLTNHPIEGLVAKHIAEVRQVVCASSVYLDRIEPPLTPNDLLKHNCISLGERTGDNHWQFHREGQTRKIKTTGSFASNHSEIRKEAVLRHMGISVFPEFAIRTELEANTLVQLLPDWYFAGSYQGAVFAQYAQSRYIPRQIREFITFCSDRVSDALK